MVSHNIELGSRGEALAEQFLSAQGYQLIARNWRHRLGEIDLVMRQGAELVFVEVKTRRSLDYGDPLAAVSDEKLHRLYRLANQWLIEHELRVSYRVDIVGILLSKTGQAQIEQIRGVRP